MFAFRVNADFATPPGILAANRKFFFFCHSLLNSCFLSLTPLRHPSFIQEITTIIVSQVTHSLKERAHCKLASLVDMVQDRCALV